VLWWEGGGDEGTWRGAAGGGSCSKFNNVMCLVQLCVLAGSQDQLCFVVKMKLFVGFRMCSWLIVIRCSSC
jgi:hypothetical protein